MPGQPVSAQHLKDGWKWETSTGELALLLSVLLAGGHRGSSSTGANCTSRSMFPDLREHDSYRY